jgi:hypothetical protein
MSFVTVTKNASVSLEPVLNQAKSAMPRPEIPLVKFLHIIIPILLDHGKH